MTSDRKWRVDRVHHVWPEPHHAWQVTEALARGVFDYHGPFPTHEEALDYANRMARTVQVTLPTYQNPTTVEADLASPVTIYTAGPLTQIEAGGMRINLFRHELEQVALALLAHHYRKGERGEPK